MAGYNTSPNVTNGNNQTLVIDNLFGANNRNLMKPAHSETGSQVGSVANPKINQHDSDPKNKRITEEINESVAG